MMMMIIIIITITIIIILCLLLKNAEFLNANPSGTEINQQVLES
jgi:hypothetical protein